MKKMIAIALVLMLCVSALSVTAFAAFDTVESLAIVGTGIPGVKEWDPADPAGDMTEVSDGIWEKTIVCPAGTSMKFKVAGNDKWDDTCNFGSATIVLGETANLECSGGSGDMPFSTAEEITIKITVDLTGDTATILVANANGDNSSANPGNPVPTPTYDAYYVTGSTEWLSNWTECNENGKMTEEDGVYVKTFENVTAGEVELKVNVGSWSKDWGYNGQNFKFTVEEGADVTVKFNPATEKVSVYVNGTEVNPATGDMSLAGVGIALLAASAGLVALVGKKKEF